MMSSTQYQDISYEVLGPVARICHARPQQGNAEGTRLLDELDDALEGARRDESVRVVIVGGQGEHFSAGHDVKEAMGRPDIVEVRYAYEEEKYLGYCLRLWDFPKPTIAQVQGACIAAGFMVANMCDLVVAADDAYFSDPTCMTLASAATEVLVHPWVLGLRMAKEFLYTGRKMLADEAHRIGMVNRVVPRSELETTTLALANDIAKAPPVAIKLLKRSLNKTADIQGFRNAIQGHFDLHELCHTTQEYKAVRAGGLAATIEKTKRG
jgi:enoyl-CoA hydratase